MVLVIALGCTPEKGDTGSPPARHADTTSSAPPASVPPAEPTAGDVVILIHSYFDAINAKRYHDAYVCWAREGEASGQSFDRFAQGFARTDSVRVEAGAPSDMDAAAGSRYITIPVRIVAYERGSEQKYSGTYTVRRSVVDGATADQRAWRIETAAVRRVSSVP